jgi:predicted  nucleic acid-binding Zn-ribbon protein
MPAHASARCLLLAVACLSAFEAGCTTNGAMIGMAPDGSSSTSASSDDTDDQSIDAASAVSSGNFRPLIGRKGAEACTAISEEDVPTNYVETVALGAAVGTVLLAVLGAAAGAILTGGRGEGAAYGAAAGAAVGAGFGAADGARTAEQKQAFAVELARYDCNIQAAEMENESLKGAGDRLRGSVDNLARQLDQLEEDYAHKRMNKAQALKELNDIDDASASLKHRLVVMKEGTGKFQQYASSTEKLAMGTEMAIDDARFASLNGQITEMEQRNANLEDEYARLVERRKALVLQ